MISSGLVTIPCTGEIRYIRPMTEEHPLEAPLLARFRALGIEVVMHRHAPLHTVEESRALRGTMPGSHIKNLFLRDKKRNQWLVTVPEDARVDLKALRHVLGSSGNLSFGSAELLAASLGVKPGAVTPFAVLNDTAGAVAMVLARSVLDSGPVNAHPLHNEATAAIDRDDLLRFLDACDHPPQLIDLP